MADNKYVVFNRKEYYDTIEANGFRRGTSLVDRELKDIELKDAVVIRRQDYFASPCLLTYATMIAMVAEHHPDEKVKAELEIIADYFHEQGVLAGEEGFKLPTP